MRRDGPSHRSCDRRAGGERTRRHDDIDRCRDPSCDLDHQPRRGLYGHSCTTDGVTVTSVTSCRLALVHGPAPAAAVFLEFGFEHMAASFEHLAAHQAIGGLARLVVTRFKLLDHLIGPTAVEHVATDDVLADVPG